MDDDWKKLVKRYADGRPICNCGHAYYTPCGVGIVDGVHKTDMPDCQYGCSANQIFAKEEIASRVMAELPTDTPPQ